MLNLGLTIEGFDLGIASMKKGEKAVFMMQAGYCIKPGNSQMSSMKFLKDGKEKMEEQPKPPKCYPDVPENLMRDQFLKFEVS